MEKTREKNINFISEHVPVCWQTKCVIVVFGNISWVLASILPRLIAKHNIAGMTACELCSNQLLPLQWNTPGKPSPYSHVENIPHFHHFSKTLIKFMCTTSAHISKYLLLLKWLSLHENDNSFTNLLATFWHHSNWSVFNILFFKKAAVFDNNLIIPTNDNQHLMN